jgi:diaminopimelate epimerase
MPVKICRHLVDETRQIDRNFNLALKLEILTIRKVNLNFYKYQGTGNDFVMIDNRNALLPRESPERYAAWCDRHFGIGADGVILIQNHEAYDFEMVYINADGREGSMCGNGGRCAVRFASDLAMISGGNARFLAIDGIHTATYDDKMVALGMLACDHPTPAAGGWFLNTGSPHHVQWVRDLVQFDVSKNGKSIRWEEHYQPDGTNVNFVEQTGEWELAVRTFERGVEAETLSCGTGVTAAALLFAFEKKIIGEAEVQITTSGGTLKIGFRAHEQGFDQIKLIGPACQVFQGQIAI